MTQDLDDPRSLGEAEWRVLPKWLKRVNAFIGVPLWFGWFYVLFAGNDFPDERTMMPIFIALGVLAAINMVMIGRAYWLREI